MQLTLRLSSADAMRLQRLPVIRAARSGRTRAQAMQIVWHDSLDRDLASQGLALAEHRESWHLERHRPDATEAWPPATDHREIAAADDLNSLRAIVTDHDALPDATTPFAAFAGRRRVSQLTLDGETVSLTLLDGVLRAVASEQPATRLILDGRGLQLRTLVLSIAESIALAVPQRSLWAEALQLADGIVLAPRRQGPPTLLPDGMSVHAAFAHIVGHLTDCMLHLAPLITDTDDGTEAVHDMRVAVRRTRSAFSLFPRMPDDPAYGNAEAGLKRLGQVLGPARDWDVFMTETAPPVEAALSEQAALHSLLRGGERHRRTVRIALADFLGGPAFRALCLELACLAAADPPAGDELTPALSEYAASVLQQRWRKLLKGGRGLAELDGQALHGLRLKAKRLRYAAEFFAPLFPEKPAARFIRRLAVLQDRLGLFNDTTVAAGLLHELNAKPGFAAGLVLGFTAARGARARAKIATAWDRFRRRDPFWG